MNWRTAGAGAGTGAAIGAVSASLISTDTATTSSGGVFGLVIGAVVAVFYEKRTRRYDSIPPRVDLDESFEPRWKVHDELMSHLPTEDQTQPVVCILAGLSGSGKSQIAAHYLHHHQGVQSVWVGRSDLQHQLAAQDQTLGLERMKGDAIEDRAARVRTALHGSGRPWIMVVDDADAHDWEIVLAAWLPYERGPGQIIITSPTKEWFAPLGAEVIEVNDLRDDQTLALRMLGPKAKRDRSAARKLIVELGYLPLAISQARSYVEARGNRSLSYADYLERLGEVPAEILASGAPNSHVLPVWKTFEPALDRCENRAIGSRQIVSSLSVLASSPLPVGAIESVFGPRAERAIRQLHSHSVVLGRPRHSIQLHETVALVAKGHLRFLSTEAEMIQAVRQASSLLGYVFEESFGDAWCLPHAMSLITTVARWVELDLIGEIDLGTLEAARFAVERVSRDNTLERRMALVAAVLLFDTAYESEPDVEWLRELANLEHSMAERMYNGSGQQALFKHSMSLFKRLGDIRSEAKCQLGLGYSLYVHGEAPYDNAISALSRALDLFQSTSDYTAHDEGLCRYRRGQALSTSGSEHRLEAISELEAAAELFESDGENSDDWRASCLYDLGTTIARGGGDEVGKGVSAIQTAMDLFADPDRDNPLGIGNCCYRLGELFFNNQISSETDILSLLKLAEDQYRRIDTTNSALGRSNVHYLRALVLAKSIPPSWDGAILETERSLDISSEIEDPEGVERCHQLLQQISHATSSSVTHRSSADAAAPPHS